MAEHYKAAIKINPNHTNTGSTYYNLSKILMKKGRYKDALRYLNIFLTLEMQIQNILEANRLKDCAKFSIKSIKNPREFNPINIGPGINTEYPEYFPTITVDGKTILFTRCLPNNRANKLKIQEDFFISNLSILKMAKGHRDAKKY